MKRTLKNSFNRTIVELKPNIGDVIEEFVAPFNRTIVELKPLTIISVSISSHKLLIVP